ncbi:hypothetical protein K0U27_00790 [archaeon]|nr:hypothetical protein [archaeon]
MIPIVFLPSIIPTTPSGSDDMGDIMDLMRLEFQSKLIEILSSEFTGNADQISYVPASGKTFYHIKSHLYPVADTIDANNIGSGTSNRRADIEMSNDSAVIDVLTHDMESWAGHAGGSSGGGAGASAGKYESNTSDSLAGDGVKAFKLTSTNNSGTYRVHMKGAIFDTGAEPSL